MLRVLLLGLWNVLRSPFYPLWWAARRARGRKTRWLRLELRPRVVELASRRDRVLARFLPNLRERMPTSLDRLRTLATKVLADPQIDGVVVTLPLLQCGWAMAEGLRGVFASLEAGGKKVLVHLPDGGGNKELWVACAAGRIAAPPQATLAPLGLVAERRYYRGLLDHVGLRLEPFARKEFKTALEGFTAEGMSGPQRAQTDALLATFDDRLREALDARLAEGTDADALYARAMLRGAEAQELGLLDDVAHEDELPALVGEKTLAPAGTYLALQEARFFRRLRRRPYVGVVEVQGAIGAKRKADAVVAALRTARKDPRCAGVVLHVDSPGGSAAVSDRIHREVARLKEKKPVVASFGDVAASGGYYVAAGADRIVAQPTTITGSIGVVAARLVATELLERLGVRTETVRRSPHGDLGSPAQPLADAERAIFDRELDGFYEDFVRLVAAGRGKDEDAIEPLARGRVWSGADAHEVGLVDALGGLDAARAALGELRAETRGLDARLIAPRRLDVAPPEPPAEAAAAAVLAELAPELPGLRQALRLARRGERVLLWAPDLPEVR